MKNTTISKGMTVFKAVCKCLSGVFDVMRTPNCWLQNYPYSPEWDAKLNLLMTSDEFKNIGKFTATIGQYEVWIKNHPYASFKLCDMDIRPKRSTILRAQRKLIGDMIESKIHAKLCPGLAHQPFYPPS